MNKTDDMVERDGKNWWWCPKHVLPGKYDGLYVTHKPEDHEDWLKRKEERRAKFSKDKTSNDKSAAKTDNGNKNLVLTDNLRAALLTRCDLTGAQADALIKDAQNDVDF